MTKGERIKELISDSGLSQTDFAARINISSPSLSNICSGKTNPSPQTVALICNEFSVNKEWIESGTGNKYTDLFDSDPFLKALKEKGISERDKTLILQYLSLSQERRKMFADFVLSLVETDK